MNNKGLISTFVVSVFVILSIYFMVLLIPLNMTKMIKDMAENANESGGTIRAGFMAMSGGSFCNCVF